MSSIAIINNEYIYKFKLFYRKSIPDLEYFYLLVTFTKYFPVILFTHSIQPNCSNHPSLFTLSKIINMFKMMRNLHFADAYNIIDDIEKSYTRTNNITMIFSVISICFSSGLLLVMILTIIIKLTYLNKVVEKVVEIFEKNITQYIR